MPSRVAAQLRAILENPCVGSRPFVCDGLPENCAVMVIGENPAVELGVDWWTFWDDDAGFDFQKFNARFDERTIEQRARLKTFNAIQHLLGPLQAAGQSCLVTNRHRNEKRDGHGSKDGSIPNDEVLKILLAELPGLKAVVSHGTHANDFIGRQSLRRDILWLEKDQFRSVSHAKIKEMAQQILVHLAPPPVNRRAAWSSGK